MAVYKDKKRGTWYTSFLYVDWIGKRCRKLKRGFLTKKAAQNWENHFKLHTATFRGHQGRVLRPDRAILSGQS